MKLPFLKLKSLEKRKVKKPSKTTCYFCTRRAADIRAYKNEQNQKIKVCNLCVEYAERRAYRKS